MNRHPARKTGRSTLSCLALALCVLAPLAAVAAETPIPEVKIWAERPTVKENPFSSIGEPLTQIEVHYHVSYSDLNLAATADADLLRERVAEAAEMACADLDRLYPLPEPDRSCVRRAERNAMSQVDDAIQQAVQLAQTR